MDTQRLSEQTGLPMKQLRTILNGKQRHISIRAVYMFSRAFHMPMRDFIDFISDS